VDGNFTTENQTKQELIEGDNDRAPGRNTHVPSILPHPSVRGHGASRVPLFNALLLSDFRRAMNPADSHQAREVVVALNCVVADINSCLDSP